VSWNEATFSACPLSRDEVLGRLADVLSEHGFETGHRIRNLTYGESVPGGDLRAAAASSKVVGWKGLSFDVIWEDASEMDARLWRDDSGAHHLVLGENGRAFAVRVGGPLHARFLAFCRSLCERLEFRYVVYDEEPLDPGAKLTPADRERVIGLLERSYLVGSSSGVLMLPHHELDAGVTARLPANAAEPVQTDSGLTQLVFLPAA
jgi:hypothetical protein